MNRTNESSLIRSLLGIPISDVVAEDADKRTPEPDPIEESAIRRLNTVAVPPLLAWDRNLQVVVIGWLEGPTAQELVQRGQGERAGELAACCGGETGTARRCYRAALPGSSGSSFPRGHRQTACWPFCPS